jgi:inner membrane protein
MDSLTQIVLGAACGEAVLGRKIGNRALLLGAIGGTIPDLDVFSNLFTDEITALAFHRGIMHSLIFGATAPFAFAWLAQRLYQSGTYAGKPWSTMIAISSALFILAVVGGINAIPWIISGKPHWPFVIAGVAGLVLFVRWLWSKFLPNPTDDAVKEVGYWQWYSLFFWSVLTHPLLDAFTNYGTQLFQPFADTRVAFNTVSVVDPFYTVPFGLCLIVCMFLWRGSRWRRIINTIGIVYSIAFLGLTVYNKMRVEAVVKQSLAAQHVDYDRFTTNPAIFQNFLWYAVVETDSQYLFGMYSFFDKEAKIDSFSSMPNNKSLLDPWSSYRDVKVLRWFSNDYCNVTQGQKDTLFFHDLRFGLKNVRFESESDYIFNFWVAADTSGVVHAGQVQETPKPGDFDKTFGGLFKRMRGRGE